MDSHISNKPMRCWSRRDTKHPVETGNEQQWHANSHEVLIMPFFSPWWVWQVLANSSIVTCLCYRVSGWCQTTPPCISGVLRWYHTRSRHTNCSQASPDGLRASPSLSPLCARCTLGPLLWWRPPAVLSPAAVLRWSKWGTTPLGCTLSCSHRSSVPCRSCRRRHHRGYRSSSPPAAAAPPHLLVSTAAATTQLCDVTII